MQYRIRAMCSEQFEGQHKGKCQTCFMENGLWVSYMANILGGQFKEHVYMSRDRPMWEGK